MKVLQKQLRPLNQQRELQYILVGECFEDDGVVCMRLHPSASTSQSSSSIQYVALDTGIVGHLYITYMVTPVEANVTWSPITSQEEG